MHVEFTFQLAALYGFLLVLARVSGVLVFVPIPGFSAAPDASRVVLALALTIALFPIWPTLGIEREPRGPSLAAGRLLAAIAGETAFGATVGLVVAFLLEGVQMAAQVLGLQAGYSYASTVDPTTQADTTTLQLMAQLLAGTLFFAFGFDRQVLRALARSLESAAGPGGGYSVARCPRHRDDCRLGCGHLRYRSAACNPGARSTGSIGYRVRGARTAARANAIALALLCHQDARSLGLFGQCASGISGRL